MDTLRERAQELLTGRLNALDALEEAQGSAARAQQELREAEAKIASAWTSATDAGWSPTELRKLGIAQPAGRRRGRGRTTKRTPPAATSTPTGPA